MPAHVIYRKTEKGTEAIANRAQGVGGKLRMLLILVDGKKTAEELTKMAVGMGESPQALEQLMGDGLIEPVATASPAVASAPSASTGDLSLVKALAVRLLAAQIGPMADELSLRLEAAKDVPQFVEAMKRAYVVVREVKGQAAADKFGTEVEAKMPAA